MYMYKAGKQHVMVCQGMYRMPGFTRMVRGVELGVATRPAEAPRLLTPSADLTPFPDSPLPATHSTGPRSFHCQQALQTILKQSEGGTTASSASQGTQQEAASAVSPPVGSSSSCDDCDTLPASGHTHQPLNDDVGSAVGLSSCGGRLEGKTAGQVCMPQQSISLQQNSSGFGPLAVCLQVDDSDRVNLALNLSKQFTSAFASAFASALPLLVPLRLPLPYLVPIAFPSALLPLAFPLPCLTCTAVLLLAAQKVLLPFNSPPTACSDECHSYLAYLPACLSHDCININYI